MKTGKRIVSKAEYARIQSRRLGLILFVLSVVVLTITTYATNRGRLSPGFIVGNLPCMLLLWIVAGNVVKKVKALGNVVPVTRANTADLPADESLVRASQEPAQEDQSILLRAAADATQTPVEQLLRPTE